MKVKAIYQVMLFAMVLSPMAFVPAHAQEEHPFIRTFTVTVLDGNFYLYVWQHLRWFRGGAIDQWN